MNVEQIGILAILAATVVLFIWGRWRHDIVSLAALLACVFTGLVPAADAFLGFGHPAVVTVACVLALSRSLAVTGVMDVITQRLLPRTTGPLWTIAALTSLAAVLSAFMNNVGALALLMPAAVQLAARLDMPPGRLLMPLAFGSILGGMTTLIGTPPNLIVSGFRAQLGHGGFDMFDFTPVGLAAAAGGVAFVALVGWRLVPVRNRSGTEGFDTGAYVTEGRVVESSKARGKTLREVESMLEDVGGQVLGLIRHEVHLLAPNPARIVHTGDILILESDPSALATVLSQLGIQLEEAVDTKADVAGDAKDAKDAVIAEDMKPAKDAGIATPAQGGDVGGNASLAEGAAAADSAEAAEPATAESATAASGAADASAAFAAGTANAVHDAQAVDDAVKRSESAELEPEGDEVSLLELAVLPSSGLLGSSATDIRLRTRYGINLLAVSRRGHRSMSRLRHMRLAAGDVLLMQGAAETILDFASEFGCVPLKQRAIRIPDARRAWWSASIMLIAVSGAAFGLVPAAVAFALGVVLTMAMRIIPLRDVYEAIDWPVVVLLSALIPVAGVMESSGAAEVLSRWVLDGVARGDAVVALVLLLVVTMTLSDFMNNAATAAVMCPIALGAAKGLQVSSDPFLMAVAVGASCAFLTPIGHQNNTLILGPGGFRFGDYWRLGLPLEILLIAISIPALLAFWPL